jgi:hypothetical protein
MRWMLFGAMMGLAACEAEEGALLEADPSQRADGLIETVGTPTGTVSNTGLDCSKAPQKSSSRCRGLGFNSTAGGSPNVIPGDWKPLDLKEGTVWYTTLDEKSGGGLAFSFDGGKSISAIVDGAIKEFSVGGAPDPLAPELVSVQLTAIDDAGASWSLGEIGLLGVDSLEPDPSFAGGKSASVR